MGDPEIAERVKNLALELQRLLKQNICKDPNLVNNEMEHARKIKEEIESMGLLVTWKVVLDTSDPKNPEVEITVWRPKENLSPELQKIYDDWFLNQQ